MDYTIHGLLQARILEWVAVPFSRGSSQPRNWNRVSCIAGGCRLWSIQLTNWITSFSAFSLWPSRPPPTGDRVYIFFCLLEVGLAKWLALANGMLPSMMMMPWKTFSGSVSFALDISLTFIQERICPRCQHQGEKGTRIRTQLVKSSGELQGPQAHRQENVMLSAVSQWHFWIVQHKALLYVKLIQCIKSSRATETKNHRLGGFNNINLSSRSPGG